MGAADVQNAFTVLVVEASPDVLTTLSAWLKPLYRIIDATSGEQALGLVDEGERPDIILLDVALPVLSGFDVCRRLKERADARQIPVVFLTSSHDPDDGMRGLALGAVDCIRLPVAPSVLLERIAIHVRLNAAADQLRSENDYLAQEVTRTAAEVLTGQDLTLLALTSLAETRDNGTGSHARRTRKYVGALTDYLKSHPRFAAELDESSRTRIVQSAPLHDIGKIGVPDRILLKPGRLTQDELAVMRTHPTLGRDAIQRAEDQIGMNMPFLRFAKEMAYSHHERWTGEGYPEGKRGDDIPVSARLMAVADVYDALSSRRAYKAGMPHEEAVAFIAARRGIDFDPDVVDAFLALQEEFQTIALHFAEDDHDEDGAEAR